MKLTKWGSIAALALAIGMPIGMAVAETTETDAAADGAMTAETDAAAEEAVAPVVDEQADAILRQMSEFLAAQKSFRLHSTRNFDLVLENGIKIQTESSADVAIQRPNGIHVTRNRVDFTQHVYYNGKELVIYRTDGPYASAPAPATIDEFLDKAIDTLGLVPPSADLLYSDPYKVLTEDRIAGIYIGMTLVDGVKCHHLYFRNQVVDWQIWVEDGDRPLPLKMLITARDEEQAPQFSARFSNWDLNPTFKEDEFTFAAPTDAIRIGIANAEAMSAN